jgi:hypothetical protein
MRRETRRRMSCVPDSACSTIAAARSRSRICCIISQAQNTLDAAGFASLDLRVSREFKDGKGDGPALTLGLDAFNITNMTTSQRDGGS